MKRRSFIKTSITVIGSLMVKFSFADSIVDDKPAVDNNNGSFKPTGFGTYYRIFII